MNKLLRSAMRRIRPWTIQEKVRWFGADNPSQAAKALVLRAKEAIGLSSAGLALIVGDGGELERDIGKRLQGLKLNHKVIDANRIEDLVVEELGLVAVVICAVTGAKMQTKIAIALAEHPVLQHCPFEAVAGLDSSREVFRRRDEYRDTDFVSSVLLDDPSPYQIYEESLEYFEQKCGLRDFLDLYQMVKHVVHNNVEGDIAEFGSFRGHSGWLIASTLEALGSSKQLYMLDTFESFPVESVGVDYFWSATHKVDFDSVKAKLSSKPNVTLIKGDFTQTLESSAVGALALAYIDCDSYRATRYLLELFQDSYMSNGSVLICEDYGHPALLGNRAALHSVFDGVPGWIRFFSQFSGLYIMLKTAA